QYTDGNVQDDVRDEHRGKPAAARNVKKRNTKDLLTIFSDWVTVKFLGVDGKSDLKVGRWCLVCKEDEVYCQKFGKRKAFHVGGNSSCHAHIRSHYALYELRCGEQNIANNHHTVLCDILQERKRKKQ
ncbi:hypothetical protein EV363DRAFT_1080628, partial [Boletus edulis]